MTNETANNAPVVEEREDLWWITDDYLSASCHMVAQQFIADDADVTYPNMEAFAERVTYVMRQHCPITYSYFFTQCSLSALPGGTIGIIHSLVVGMRPGVVEGVDSIARPIIYGTSGEILR